MTPPVPPVTIGLIAATVAISAYALLSPGAFRTLAESPYEMIHRGRWSQAVTSGLVHVGPGHLAMNMLTLFFFGPFLERTLGGGRFLVLYGGSLLAGSALTAARHHRDPLYRAAGASGAISGVLFAFVLFRPFDRIYLFFVPVGIPALLFAAGYVAASIYGMRTRRGRIGHEAHLGGALGGAAITLLLRPDALRIFLDHFR